MTGRGVTLRASCLLPMSAPPIMGGCIQIAGGRIARLGPGRGVGPTLALALLSVFAPHDLALAIARGDTAALKAVKGVGQKTAERLCLELRDAMAKLDLPAAGERPLPSRTNDDAIAALVTLGYSEKDARDKVEKVRRSAAAPAAGDIEGLIKAVLQM